MSTEKFQDLGDLLKFRPRWWWDPVPDWVIRELDREILLELATIQLEFQRKVFEQQAVATKAAVQALQKVGRG